MTRWKCTTCGRLRPIEDAYCPDCGAGPNSAEVYDPHPAPPDPVRAEHAPPKTAPIILIAAVIGTISATVINQPLPDAIITGLINFLIWLGILYLITRIPRRACLIIAALIAAGIAALIISLSWPAIFPPKPTPNIIIITATPSPLP